MTLRKLAPLVGVLAYVVITIWPREGLAGPADEPKYVNDSEVVPAKVPIPDNPSALDDIVGEFNLITGIDKFLPHQTCQVDMKLDLLVQLQECKNQRKGWLRL
tara:strand:- start:6949 stop:7257 length:309 start_codon:yes stop_codon:yes gene_type:complete